MNNDQVMHAMSVDDSYHVERVLAQGQGGITELVTLDGTGPFVRKRIPSARAHRGVWATLPEIDFARLPHIEATYEMPDEFIVVYDYVPGETVEQLVEGRDKLDPSKARQLIDEVCQAVSKLHAHDIVHRDITPSNVVVAADGAHLIDFGTARLGSEDAKGNEDQLGTWGFAAPEQYGFAKTDARSDVYSIGRLLGYLLMGVHPEDKEGYEEALASPDVPNDLRSVILKATEFEPSARYQSAAELERALHNAPGEKDGTTVATAAIPRNAADAHPASAPRRARTIALVCVIAAIAVVAALLAMRFFVADKTSGSQATSGSSAISSGNTTVVTEQPDETDIQASADALSIGESHWSVSYGSLYAEYSLTNNSDYTVMFPSLTITGYADDGSVLFSNDQVLSQLAPGATTYQSTILDGSTIPARVEFTPISPIADNLTSNMPPSLSTSGVTARSDDTTGITVSGFVTLEKDGSTFSGSNYGVWVTAILRDASGNMVGGGVNYLTTHPAEGSSVPFDVKILDTVDYATCEAYALAW